MALPAVSISGGDVAEIIREEFETPFLEAMERDVFVLNRVGRESGKGRGVYFKAHIAGNSSVGSYGEADTIPTAGKQSYANAGVTWQQNWVTIHVSGLAQAETRGSGGYMEVLAEETEEGIEDLKDEINSQLLNNSETLSASTDLPGLGILINDANTYAGLDRSLSANAWFRSVVDDVSDVTDPVNPADEVLTLAMMQNMMKELKKPYRKSKMNEIWTSVDHFYQYGDLFEEQRRWVDPTGTYDFGFLALAFEGKPLIAVPELANGVMYFIDTSTIKYVVLEDFQVKPKSTDTDSDRFIITHYSTLVCREPRKNGKIVGLPGWNA